MIHHRHYILLTFDYMLYSVHYIMRKSLHVGQSSLYYENFHYMISKHLYIMVDLHHMMSKHLYMMVDLHYMLIQPHYIMYVSHYIMGYCLYMHQVDYMVRIIYANFIICANFII